MMPRVGQYIYYSYKKYNTIGLVVKIDYYSNEFTYKVIQTNNQFVNINCEFVLDTMSLNYVIANSLEEINKIIVFQ